MGFLEVPKTKIGENGSGADISAIGVSKTGRGLIVTVGESDRPILLASLLKGSQGDLTINEKIAAKIIKDNPVPLPYERPRPGVL